MTNFLDDRWVFVGSWPGISLNSSMIWQSKEAVELFYREFQIWRGLGHIFLGQGRTTTMEEYIRESLQSEISAWLHRTMKEEPENIMKFLRAYHSYVPEFQVQVRALIAPDITYLTNNELADRFVSIRSLQTKMGLYDQFGMYSERFFQKQAEQVLNAHTNDSQERLDLYTTLTLPWSHSTLQCEELASLKLLRELAQNSSGLQDLASADARRIRLWLGSNALQQIQSLVERFSWVPIFLHNPAWGEDHFIRQLTDFALHFHSLTKSPSEWLVQLKSRITELEAQPRESQQKAKSLIKNLDLSKYEETIFEAFRLAMDSRNEAEYQIGLGSFVLQPVIDEICKRLGISEDMFHCLYTEEVAGLLTGSLSLDDIPISRLLISGNWFQDERELTPMKMEEAREFHKRHRRMHLANAESARTRGIGVSKGKAEGIACVVRGPQDFMKFQEGNILVAEYTTADYVPLMRMAAGVITEHGGLTCHAAIVSRELGVPAIVGYPAALQIFRDGQQLRFNAADGVAHIVEHARSGIIS